MEDHEFDAKLKRLRRDVANEMAAIEEAVVLVSRNMRAKANDDDVATIAMKISNVETDLRDSIKSLRSDVQDLRHTFSSAVDRISTSVTALSDTMTSFRREADGRTAEIVTRILADRRPIHPALPAAGGAGAVTLIGTILYLLGVGG